MEADYNTRIAVFVCLASVFASLGCADLSERAQIDTEFTHPSREEAAGGLFADAFLAMSNALAAAHEILITAGWNVQVASTSYRQSVTHEDAYFEQVGPRSFQKPSRTLLVSRAENDSRSAYEMEFEEYQERTVICEIRKFHDWGNVNPFGPGVSRERVTYEFKRDILLPIKRTAEARTMVPQG